MADVIFDIGGGNNDYSTLSAAEAAQEAIRPNLVANDEQLIFRMFAFNDTTAASIAGTWTTDATRRIVVTSPSGQRHSGTFNTARAYMSNTASNCLTMNVANTLVEWMQFTVSTANVTCITTNSAGVMIRNCILRATDVNPQILCSITAACTIRNTLVYNSGRHGIFVNSNTVTLQNVTVAGCPRNGIWNLGGTANVICTNVLASGNGNGTTLFDFDNSGGGMTGNMTTCASADGTADDFGGTGNRAGQTFSFVNAGSGDFHLTSSDAGARDFGTDLSGTFPDDIDGETRSGTWDIGADEYLAPASGGFPFPVKHSMAHMLVR